MAANIYPIFPVSPWASSASLTNVSGCTTRAPIAHASLTITPCFAVQLSTTSTNGRRIDKIQVQGAASSIAATNATQTVLLWMSDGTTGYVIDEILVPSTAASTSNPAVNVAATYTDLVLPPTYTLWVSTTTTTTAATTALIVTAFGGDY